MKEYISICSAPVSQRWRKAGIPSHCSQLSAGKRGKWEGNTVKTPTPHPNESNEGASQSLGIFLQLQGLNRKQLSSCLCLDGNFINLQKVSDPSSFSLALFPSLLRVPICQFPLLRKLHQFWVRQNKNKKTALLEKGKSSGEIFFF